MPTPSDYIAKAIREVTMVRDDFSVTALEAQRAQAYALIAIAQLLAQSTTSSEQQEANSDAKR